jgi:hypothetical protein
VKRSRGSPFALGVSGGLAAAWLRARHPQRLALARSAGEGGRRAVGGLATRGGVGIPLHAAAGVRAQMAAFLTATRHGGPDAGEA